MFNVSYPGRSNRDNIAPLEGENNYEPWAQQLSMIFDAMGATEIVVDGYQPPIGASEAEKTFCAQEVVLALVQVISRPILLQIGRQRSPHNIWVYLRETYYKDSPLSFVHEICALNNLHSTMDPSTSISKFIDEYEVRWMRIHAFTSSATPGSGKAIYRTVLENQELKRDFLLVALVNHYPNIIDN